MFSSRRMRCVARSVRASLRHIIRFGSTSDRKCPTTLFNGASASRLTGIHYWTLVLCVSALQVSADDWPQWMGPQRDNVWREAGIVDHFPADGPPVVWRAPISGGYSGPAVVNGNVYVMDFIPKGGTNTLDFNNRDRRHGQERVLCFDQQGKLRWQHSYDTEYLISYATGPRCTPTVADGKVYTLGAMGKLICFQASDGKILWHKDFREDYKADTPMWGFCGHPLVDGKRLFCVVGGEGSIAVAFDKDNGKELWRSLTARESGYCPPTMIQAGGKRQLLIWHAESLNSLDPKTGSVYWSHSLVPSYGMAVAAPRRSGDLLYTSGIRDVSLVVRLLPDRPMAEEVWRGEGKTAVPCSNSTPFLENGMVYGADCNTGHLRGVRLATGDRIWETLAPTAGGERRASHGTVFIVKHEDRFFLFSETGDLIIARLTPERYEELSRAHLLEATGTAFGRNVVWCHPAFANRCVYVRNDKELVCVSLAKEG